MICASYRSFMLTAVAILMDRAQSAKVCIDDPPGWYDSDSMKIGCDWYAQGNRCSEYGGYYKNFGKTSNEACCACGGGKMVEAGAAPSPPASQSPPSTKASAPPSNQCVDDPKGWYDQGGKPFDCNWYAQKNRCQSDGNGFKNFGKSANQACCACGGGKQVGGTVPSPPTPKTEDAPSPKMATSECEDSPNDWHDSGGRRYDCDWYESNGRCSRDGDKYRNFGKTANQACCACGGGETTKKDTAPSPTPKQPPSPPSPSAVCVDDPPGWYDSPRMKVGCDWYAQGNNCQRYGGYYTNFGKTSNEACCACGGGNMVPKGDPIPIQSPRTTVSPTPEPSPPPTRAPTSKPTQSPTQRPTPQPSLLPTTKPTPSPTQKPTPKPSPRPTRTSKPTPSPTGPPTLQPSLLPTTKPTPSPTQKPTPEPSPRPTPTSKPTLPTARPNARPTPTPARSPTNGPTSLPTPEPRQRRTLSPTMEPTISPTQKTTSVPTPSLTPLPTLQPTSQPTLFPTQKPTPTQEAPNRPKSPSTKALDSLLIGTGKACVENSQCKSDTCRNGVCMASSECYPIKHKNGVPFDQNAVNLVFVASGFDTTTHKAWRTRVEKTYGFFRNYNMFSDEVDQLNVFLVDPVDLSSSFCHYGCMGVERLLCCDTEKAELLSNRCFPVGANLQTVVIHNNRKYGGAGYTNLNLATMSIHPQGPFVAVHEIGHSLFELADEYSYADGTDKDPNCAATSDCTKWSDLIEHTPAGYNQVSCEPGCYGEKYFVAGASYMNELRDPVGAVNERFTCCTYQALTKSMPSYCDVFDFGPNYLFEYCQTNDYQNYGASNYDLDTAIQIKAPSAKDRVSLEDPLKYIYVSDPELVKIKLRKNGRAVVWGDPVPLPQGMYHKFQVLGHYRNAKDAAKQGADTYMKVRVFYGSGKQTLLFSHNNTIEVPLLFDEGRTVQDDAPRTVSRKSKMIEMVLDTKGRKIKKVRALMSKGKTSTVSKP